MNFEYDDAKNKTYTSFTITKIVEHLNVLAEEYGIEKYPGSHRTHLGVSIIGDKCSRKLWYSFRWVKLEHFSGRMRRLFARGHSEESSFIDLLHWMGFFVREINPYTNKQYQFSDLNGHYGGSGDSVMLMPWDRAEDGQRILAEYKTHNNKSFEKLKSEKLKLSKPQHYAQMCGYGLEFQLKYGLYCAKNKDTEEIYWEFVELDWNYARQLKNKAKDIIEAKLPPPRLSDNPAYFECKYCNFAKICHDNEPVEINCRSCKFSIPIENAQWKCTRFNDIIPKAFISKGCEQHVSVNS